MILYSMYSIEKPDSVIQSCNPDRFYSLYNDKGMSVISTVCSKSSSIVARTVHHRQKS